MRSLIGIIVLTLTAMVGVYAQGVVRNGGSGGGGGETNVGIAETLTDAMSNPSSAGKVTAYLMCFNGSTWDRCLSSTAAGGGASTQYLSSAATTNATSVKASAGTLYDVSVVNTTATLYYLRLYNLATAPTCSSATGFVETIPVPASTSGAGIAKSFPIGRDYSAGIAYCLTGGGSSTDNTAAATGVYVSLGYK